MKKTTFSFAVLFICSLCFFDVAFAAKNKVQPPQNLADRQTFFNNITDFFATLGLSEKEKKEEIRIRKQQRRDERLRKERRNRRLLIRRQMRKQQKVIIDKIKARRSFLSR